MRRPLRVTLSSGAIMSFRAGDPVHPWQQHDVGLNVNWHTSRVSVGHPDDVALLARCIAGETEEGDEALP